MTLKGKVIVVLAVLVALIACVGVTVFSGLQLGQGALDDISADAGRLDDATLPFLIVTQNLKREADRIAQAPGPDSGTFDRHIGDVRGLARDMQLAEALTLVDALVRQRRAASPQLAETAGQLLVLAENQARSRVAALNSGTASLGDANRTLKALVLLFTGIGVMIALFGAVWLYRNISISIALVQRDIGVLSAYASCGPEAGDAVALRLDEGRPDEFGMIGAALGTLAHFLAKGKTLARSDAQRRKERLHEAERLERLTGAFSDRIGEIIRAVSAASTELESTAQAMAATAEENGRQSASVAASASQASKNVQSLAAASAQLGTAVGDIARELSDSARIAERADGEADRTDTVVQDLSDAALRITEVTRLISEVAGQTNLLALNATIEAARAGEAGKGFAVVAQEVKNLAAQTTRATEDISQQINTVQEETQSAVVAIETIRGTIREMTGIAMRIASAIEDLDSGIGDIRRNAEEAAQGADSVTANIEGVSQSAQDTGASSAQVLQASGNLHRQAEALRGEIERFLAEVKGA